LAKWPPIRPYVVDRYPGLGQIIDDLLSFPAYPLFKLRLLLEAFASQLIEEMHPAVIPLPLVERLAAFGCIGVTEEPEGGAAKIARLEEG
jgi:hypothetical protein